MNKANDQILEAVADRSDLEQQLRGEKIKHMYQNLRVVSARKVGISRIPTSFGRSKRLESPLAIRSSWSDAMGIYSQKYVKQVGF